MGNEEKFRTRDLGLAAAVSLLGGTNPTLEADRRGSIIFIFEESDEIRKLAEAYIAGTASGSLLNFSERLKSLRSSMFNAQDLAR